MIRFHVRPHSTRHGEQTVEVERDGEFVGALYPEADGVRFVSAYDGMVRARIETTGFVGSPELLYRTRRIDIEIREERLT